MPCRDCLHYLDSVTANAPRWGLADYGYCKAAGSPELRARFFHADTECWLDPAQNSSGYLPASPGIKERRK